MRLLKKLNTGLRAKNKCNHIWDTGTLVDLGRNKLWKCIKCGKIKTLL